MYFHIQNPAKLALGIHSSRFQKIQNWRVLKPDEKPMPGDIAAYNLPPQSGPGGWSGHSGIVISDGKGGIRTLSAHQDDVSPRDTSDTDRQFLKKNKHTVYRRYTGE